MKTITVTRWDILLGKKKSVLSCPIALAAQRAFPEAIPRVDSSYVFGLGVPNAALPEVAKDFVKRFDRQSKLVSFLRGGITFVV